MFVYKRKNGYWYVSFKDENGKRRYVSAETKLKAEAAKFLQNLKTELHTKAIWRFTPIKLQAFRLEYLKYAELNFTEKTVLTYKTTFNKLEKYFGNIQLDQLTEKEISDFLKFRTTKSSIYAARKDLINIKASLNFAVEKNYVISNAAKGIKRIKPPEKLPTYYTPEEYQKLLDTIDDELIRDITIMAANTGMRQGEILQLRKSQCDLGNQLVVLNNHYHVTKSKRIRIIPLNENAFKIIEKRYYKNTDLIFMRDDQPLNQDFLIHKFKTYVIDAGLNPTLNFHSLRHTFASWLVQKNVPIQRVSKLLGHADLSTTQIYAHLRADDLREAVNVL